MDKYETKLRLEEIEKLKKRKKYKEAARLADTIEWNRIRSASTLYKAGLLYKICQEYSKSIDLLVLAYERSPYAKPIIFALCEVCLLDNKFEEATQYYREYSALAEGEPGHYVLKYKMLKSLDAGINEQIEVLEALREKNRQEEWLYELAVLYHNAGMPQKCVEQCDEIAVWFGNGSYVCKALELKQQYEPLTQEQLEIIARKEEEKAQKEAQREARRAERAERAERAASNTGKIPGKEKRKTDRMPKQRDVERAAKKQSRYEENPENEQEEYHVKTINMGKFNTMDLQKELAENLQEYIGDAPSMIDRVNLVEEEGAQEVPSATEQLAKTIVVSNETDSFADSEEVFFEDSTEDLRFPVDVPKASEEDNKRLQEFKEQYSREMKGKVLPEGFGRLSEEGTVSQESLSFTGGIVEEKVLGDGTVELIKRFAEDAEPEVVKVSKDKRTGQTGPMQTGAVRRKPRPEEKRETRPIRVKSDDPDYVDMLPASEEKQVSGQLNIQDILAGWEKQKKQMEERRQEDFRKKTLENTGNLFADFDKEANSGLLATLENPSLINSVTEQSTPDDFLKGVSVEDVKNGKKPTYLRKSDMAAIEEGLKVGKVIEAPAEEPENDEDLIDEEIVDIKEVTYEAEESKASEEVTKEPEAVEEELPEEADEEDFSENADEFAEDSEEEEIAEEEIVEEEDEEEAVEEAAVEETPAPEYYDEEEDEEELSDEELEDAEIEEPEPVQDGEKSQYFGSVTEKISGNIWDEVDNVVPTPVAEETVEAVEEAPTKVIPSAQIEESLAEDSAEETPVEAQEEEQDTVAESDEEESAEDDQQDLIKELKKYFDIYMYSKKMKAQIVDAAENASLAAYCGNLIVTSDSPESAEQFARAFSRYLKASDPNLTGKPARISAKAVNGKDVNEIFEKAVNSCVVISRAGRLTNNSINKILKCLNQETNGVEVILYDTKAEIRKLLERGPVLERFFNCRVDIVALSTEMLAEYGRKYAMERGYSIDEMAMLAFSERIAELQVGMHEVTINEVKDIVEDAIEHVNKPGLEKLIRTITGKRYDENHRVILREKDFWYRGKRAEKDKNGEDEDEKPVKKEKKEKK